MSSNSPEFPATCESSNPEELDRVALLSLDKFTQYTALARQVELLAGQLHYHRKLEAAESFRMAYLVVAEEVLDSSVGAMLNLVYGSSGEATVSRSISPIVRGHIKPGCPGAEQSSANHMPCVLSHQPQIAPVSGGYLLNKLFACTSYQGREPSLRPQTLTV